MKILNEREGNTQNEIELNLNFIYTYLRLKNLLDDVKNATVDLSVLMVVVGEHRDDCEESSSLNVARCDFNVCRGPHSLRAISEYFALSE